MRLQLGQHREVPGGHFTPKLLVEGGQGAGGHLTPGGQWQATVGTGKLSVRGKFYFCIHLLYTLRPQGTVCCSLDIPCTVSPIICPGHPFSIYLADHSCNSSWTFEAQMMDPPLGFPNTVLSTDILS